MFKIIFLIILILQLSFSSTIKIASIDWCPQLCPNEKKEGYVIDILNEVFKNSPYPLDIKSYPWSRSINMAKNGEVLALLSPAKAEAPMLNYPKLEVGKQMMCFFTTKNSQWKYTGIGSLKNQIIGIASDTSIEELNEYVKKNREQFQFLPYSQNYIGQSLKKLQHNRFDTFLFTKNSTIYKINSLNLSNEYKIAGCVSSANIYMAFTPLKKHEKEVKSIIKYFDNKMKELKQSNKIQKIMERYGLDKWD